MKPQEKRFSISTMPCFTVGGVGYYISESRAALYVAMTIRRGLFGNG
jgi:hypothetical protein